ncbi:hypothetical protein PV325_004616 [Microctonus aethiopoides]|nr:hypothetical protein PV325_004616 [Microctonus aethiopoides]
MSLGLYNSNRLEYRHDSCGSKALYSPLVPLLPSWFVRPDATVINSSPSSNTLLSSSLTSSGNQVDLLKASEPPTNRNKVHGQTPTICTVPVKNRKRKSKVSARCC